MGAASCAIVLNTSIASVSLGMTKAKVMARLGPPLRVRQVEAIGPVPETEYTYARVTVRFDQGKARMLVTRHAGERLTSGVGVGSTLGALRKAVHGLDCQAYGQTIDCYAGRANTPGAAATRFTLRKGSPARIREIAVYRVID